MKKYRKHILVCAGFIIFTNVSAQQQNNDSTVNRTVVVENQYNPEVMDAFKVNVLPKIEEPAVAKTQIDYASTVRPLGSFPVYHMDVTNREMSYDEAKRGYIRLSYGNRNNTDLKGSYLWNISDSDVLDVMASFYGYSGCIGVGYDFDPVTDIPSLNKGKEWEHRFFRTDASLRYSHNFRKVSFYTGGNFMSQVFNYMPDVQLGASSVPSFGHQHFMSGEGYLGLSSVKKVLPVEFAFQIGYKGFSRKHDIYLADGVKENTVHTQGFMSAPINDNQAIGVSLEMDNVFYDNSLNSFSLVKLRPYYCLNNDVVRLVAGLNVDFQIANNGGLKLSPDVRFNYNFADTYMLYASVVGNATLNDFGRLNKVSPYWAQPNQLKTSYTPYDIKLGLKASPLIGLGMNIYGGYRETKDELFSMPYLNNGGIYNSFAQTKARVAYAVISSDYSYRDWFDLGFVFNYYNWNVTDGMDVLLWLKPQYILDFNARAKIFSGMYATIHYTYESRNKSLGMKTNAVNELNLGAEYSFNNRFNVFLKFSNLLNKYYITETGFPVQGFNLMAGISDKI